MSNGIEIAYTSFAKVVLGSLGLLIIVYLSAGFVSEIFFECVQISTADFRATDFATAAQLCEMYRPFFLLELLISRGASIALTLTAVSSLFMFVGAILWNRVLMRELGILGVSALMAFLSYRYFAARTLHLSDFSNQKSSGLLRSVTMETKCPWRGWSCFASDTKSSTERTAPRRPSE